MIDFLRKHLGPPPTVEELWPNPHAIKDDNVFIHLVQDHGLIVSNKATEKGIRRTHSIDHKALGEKAHSDPWHIGSENPDSSK